VVKWFNIITTVFSDVERFIYLSYEFILDPSSASGELWEFIDPVLSVIVDIYGYPAGCNADIE